MKSVCRFLVFLLSILSTVNSIVLNCDFKYLTDLEDQSRDVYACFSMDLANTLQGASLHYVTNLHEQGQRDRDVKIFTVRKQICSFVPMRIENFFPFLQELEIDSSGLRKVSRDNFANLPQLKTIILPGNNLEHLPGDLFSKNPRIMHIDVSKNRIKSIGHELFENLYQLDFLNFNDNICFEGMEKFETDVILIRDEVVANCSAIARQEKKIKSQKEEENLAVSGKLLTKIVTTSTSTSRTIISTIRTTLPPFETNEIPFGRDSEPKQLVSGSTRISITSKIIIVSAICSTLLFLQRN